MCCTAVVPPLLAFSNVCTCPVSLLLITTHMSLWKIWFNGSCFCPCRAVEITPTEQHIPVHHNNLVDWNSLVARLKSVNMWPHTQLPLPSPSTSSPDCTNANNTLPPSFFWDKVFKKMKLIAQQIS